MLEHLPSKTSADQSLLSESADIGGKYGPLAASSFV